MFDSRFDLSLGVVFDKRSILLWQWWISLPRICLREPFGALGVVKPTLRYDTAPRFYWETACWFDEQAGPA